MYSQLTYQMLRQMIGSRKTFFTDSTPRNIDKHNLIYSTRKDHNTLDTFHKIIKSLDF